MTPPARWVLGVAIAVPVLGLVELVAHYAFTQRAPTQEQWAAAKPVIESLKQSDDLVVVAPRWAEPHGRVALGETLMPLRDIARPDESRYARVIELSAVGQHLEEIRGWKITQERPLDGGLLVRILENPSPAHVVTDFTDLVDEGRAQVSWVIQGQSQICPWRTPEVVVAPGLFGYPAMPSKRFACGREGWQSVGVTVQDDDHYYARRCVWSHPPSRGEAVIKFVGVQLGEVIRGHSGIHETLAREQRGAPVDLEISVDGDVIGTAHHIDGQTWARSKFEFSLGSHASATNAEVTFRVLTRDANERHFCWEADSR
ncbi:MAG: hypothetical protein U0165_08055 [Polyangiaceae bacterium]